MSKKQQYKNNFFLLSFLISFSISVWADDDTRIQDPSSVNDAVAWIYRESSLKTCSDAEADRSDIVEGQRILEQNSLRVLVAERNKLTRSADQKACGAKGDFIACYSIFSDDKAKALALNQGFKERGPCGTAYKKKSN
ncbi:MAG: hypothetical protein K1X29_10385 [Bdellovibrionales bacterium]|nr:hypothetical protein [Bdellovibrionales bacterium]